MSGVDLNLKHSAASASGVAQVYTDLNSLQNLKYSSDGESKEALEQAVKQFESLFISMMLKSMRDANAIFEEDSLFNSSESNMYRDMLDGQMAIDLAENGGMGLAEVLMRQLNSSIPEASSTYGRDRFMVDKASDVASTMVQQLMRKPIVGKVDQSANVNANDSDRKITLETNEPDEVLDSPLAFIRKMMPYAQEIASKLGIEPKILVAQSALETGWGQKMIQREDGGNSFNLFGIKADSRWSGDTAEVTTTEFRQGVALKETAAFRAYDSFLTSFDDYATFLQQNDRYQNALQHGGDSVKFLQGLQQAGYATDPEYAEKILRIADSNIFDNWQ
ncbi:flagellar assembly peptidoglycan hydrolase FlgJ [Aestuariirhabdus sp. Z084]|uniref:flagellar assembly peptidoglycan hydrolase FlgJ n=1 Tax=Aestuariirhabdus haliotis TaxID=2918751 RepID=UPI00201B3A0B|nr:flagellar assembly peptidoglycan hydrolase FlgJ [Aestuariirhabdus haliotis]MCL6414448.1 flagellar assembly peptidoglycan hydrolase FlgJ [Aestuariirhabdus haliotis]MCL6418570.1 flagellar assembly peptidoglycan hydrolase FlgJ [Aestuariirhabdus haliotis]